MESKLASENPESENVKLLQKIKNLEHFKLVDGPPTLEGSFFRFCRVVLRVHNYMNKHPHNTPTYKTNTKLHTQCQAMQFITIWPLPKPWITRIVSRSNHPNSPKKPKPWRIWCVCCVLVCLSCLFFGLSLVWFCFCLVCLISWCFFCFVCFIRNTQQAEVLRRGERFVAILYSYRSLSKAMPMVCVIVLLFVYT